MNRIKLAIAIQEAERFLERARDLPDAVERILPWHPADGETYMDDAIPPIHGGAIRRASMDLTRALADLRRPDV